MRHTLVAACAALWPVLVAGPSCGPPDEWGSGGDGDTDVDGDSDTDSDADRSCPAEGPYCSTDRSQLLTCDQSDGSVTVLQTCGEGEACTGEGCATVICQPGTMECIDEGSSRMCGADGTAWEERSCGDGRRCFAETGACGVPCILRVFILLDSSGSMAPQFGSKWAQAREALSTLFASPEAQEVEFGFGIFPSGADQCSLTGQVVYPVPEATPPLVDAYFVDNSPVGGTPLVAALRRHLDDIGAGLSDPAYANFILLVSDGDDSCYEHNCIASCGIDLGCILNCETNGASEVIRQAGEVTVRLRDERAIRTFVIGFGEGVNDAELTAIAGNGGTVLGRWLQATDVEDLAAAFETVLGEMLQCNPIVS